MSRHRLSILRDAAFVTLALAGGFLGLASSAEAEDTSAAAEKTSVELRFTLTSPSGRWSKVGSRSLSYMPWARWGSGWRPSDPTTVE